MLSCRSFLSFLGVFFTIAGYKVVGTVAFVQKDMHVFKDTFFSLRIFAVNYSDRQKSRTSGCIRALPREPVLRTSRQVHPSRRTHQAQSCGKFALWLEPLAAAALATRVRIPHEAIFFLFTVATILVPFMSTPTTNTVTFHLCRDS